MDAPKWKRFEKLAYEIQKELAGDADVKLNDSIEGVDSKVARQIDISIRKQIGQYAMLIVIDCKDYSEPLDVKDIETFSGLVKDVRADRGALIVSSSFTPAALNVAKNEGIDTYRLVDTESKDWKTYASLPCLLERTYLKASSFQFSSVAMQHWELPISQEKLMSLVFSETDGTRRGTLAEMTHRKWDKAEMPREPGLHEVLLGEHLITDFDEIRSHTKVVARALVAKEFYFGPLPIKLRGLENSQTGGVITRTLTTDFIEPRKIESGEDPNWKRIDDPAKLAVVKPAIHLGYFDVYRDDPAQPDGPAARPKL
jgi:hypothetical protein